MAAADLAAPPSEPELAAALAFRQRRIVLEAVGLAVDGFVDRALCGFALLALFVNGGARGIGLRVR